MPDRLTLLKEATQRMVAMQTAVKAAAAKIQEEERLRREAEAVQARAGRQSQ